MTICSGLASLHLAVFSERLPLTASTLRAGTALATDVALALDHSPRQTLNRGPPLLADPSMPADQSHQKERFCMSRAIMRAVAFAAAAPIMPTMARTTSR